MIEQNFVKIYEDAIKNYWSLPAVANYDLGNSYSYAEMGKWIMRTHLMLKQIGVKRGDKVALIGKDSAEWCMTWLGVISYGAILVPILPDFSGIDILNIIDHSDSVAVFVGEGHKKMMDLSALPKVQTILDIKSQQAIPELTRNSASLEADPDALFKEQYPGDFTKEHLKLEEVSNEAVMIISYTSGTSGFSKGVMTTANNLAANIVFAIKEKIIQSGDKVLSFLPNAHAYGCTFSFLLPLAIGGQVFILGYKPTGTILMKAFKDVRPSLILSVPLIFEKLYKKPILPEISKTKTKIALSTPILRDVVYRKIKDSLHEALGGKLNEVVIGGAAMNEEVISFMSKIKFPFTVGYGMTECAPLISYSNHKYYEINSVGKVLPKWVQDVRIVDTTEIDGNMVGEIQVRGENVCKGYYKNPEGTEELFTSDGWMHTGDLGYMNKNGVLYLKGRSKALILSSSGENIFPEKIERKIGLLPYINDSLVVQRGNNQLVALVTLDKDTMKQDGIVSEKDIQNMLENNRKELNGMLAAFEQVATFEVLEGDFEKTPKQSIKRYKYQ